MQVNALGRRVALLEKLYGCGEYGKSNNFSHILRALINGKEPAEHWVAERGSELTSVAYNVSNATGTHVKMQKTLLGRRQQSTGLEQETWRQLCL